jgi:hypothetical protein
MMQKENAARYLSEDLTITKAVPTPVDELRRSGRAVGLGDELVEKRIKDSVVHAARLDSIHIEDPESQRSLFAQAISALHEYLKERQELNSDFGSIACFTEPNGTRFFVGNLKWKWDGVLGVFALNTIEIIYVCDSPEALIEMARQIQSFSPGTAKMTSDSALAALRKHKETT